VAWHTLFDELELRPETVGAHGVRPIQWSNLFHNFSCVSPVDWVDARKPNTIIDWLVTVFSSAIAYDEDSATTNSRHYSPVSLANQRRISSTWKP
jgi:hypothetical protein